MMGGLLWEDPAGLGVCSLGKLVVVGSPGVAQVVTGLSLFLICKRARRILQRGVLGLIWEIRCKGTKGLVWLCPGHPRFPGAHSQAR